MPPNGKGKGKSKTSGEPSASPVPQETPPPVESLDSEYESLDSESSATTEQWKGKVDEKTVCLDK